jgi:hypothetical protein
MQFSLFSSDLKFSIVNSVTYPLTSPVLTRILSLLTYSLHSPFLVQVRRRTGPGGGGVQDQVGAARRSSGGAQGQRGQHVGRRILVDCQVPSSMDAMADTSTSAGELFIYNPGSLASLMSSSATMVSFHHFSTPTSIIR